MGWHPTQIMPAPSNINIFWGKGSPQGLPFFGAVVRFDESGKLGCGLFGCLPSQSFASQMPALPRGEPRSRCECVCSYAQSKLVSPFGRDVAQRQRGLAPSLRELDLPQAKTEGAASYLSRIRQTLARTRQRAAPSVTAYAVTPSSGRKAFVLRANKNRASFDTLSLGGGGFAFLRKSHAGCNMHPACCQEPAFESTAPILNLEGKTKESTDLYSLLWWEVVDSNHRSR